MSGRGLLAACRSALSLQHHSVGWPLDRAARRVRRGAHALRAAPSWHAREECPGAPTLYLVDGMNIIHRVHHGFPDPERRLWGAGIDTTIQTCFLNFLLDVMDLSPTPTHLAVVLDSKNAGTLSSGYGGAPPQPLTWRHELYQGYKANRDPPQPIIYESADHIQRLLALMNVPCVREAGVEADDCIATLARRASEAGMLTTIISLDSDYYQLLSPQVRMLKPPAKSNARSTGEPYLQPFTDEDYREKFPGTEPGQWVDILALRGDKSDNILGVKGIGEKTSLSLVAEWGSVEVIFDNKEHIRETRARNCLASDGAWEAAMLSKRLVTLNAHVRYPSLEAPLENFRCRAPSSKCMKRLVTQMEALEMLRVRDRLLASWEGHFGVQRAR